MKSTTVSTTNNPQNHGSRIRQPIAVLSHPNMYSAIIIWKNNNTRQTQYSFQQTTKAPHTFPYPKSETLTMTSNELWNVNTLELPSTIAAANAPSSSTATTLSTEIAALEATRITKAAEFNKFQSTHKDLKKKSNETEEILAKDLATLQQLAAQTNAPVEATLREKAVIAKIKERTDNLVNKATPLHVEIEKIETQLDKKITKAKKAREAEAKASLRSEVQLKYHRSSGKAFIKAMKKRYKFSEWKSTKDNRNIGPRLKPFFSSFTTCHASSHGWNSKFFLGYKSPNHNLDGALTKMLEEKCLLKQLTR
jgi:hypothetical protein